MTGSCHDLRLNVAFCTITPIKPAGVDIKSDGDNPCIYAPVMNYASRISVSKEMPAAVGTAVAHNMTLFDATGELATCCHACSTGFCSNCTAESMHVL
jgi:hypothetical protein